MNWLKGIFAFLAGLPKVVLFGIRKAAPYIDMAMKLSATAAAIVGGPAGQTVAGVLAVADKFGVQVLIQPDATDAQIGTAIRDAIAAAIKMKFPTASTADLNRAIELAYGAVKASQQ